MDKILTGFDRATKTAKYHVPTVELWKNAVKTGDPPVRQAITTADPTCKKAEEARLRSSIDGKQADLQRDMLALDQQKAQLQSDKDYYAANRHKMSAAERRKWEDKIRTQEVSTTTAGEGCPARACARLPMVHHVLLRDISQWI